MRLGKDFLLHFRHFMLLFAILLLAWVIYTCKREKIESDYIAITPIVTHFNGDGFAGSETCAACHLDIYKTHLETAHYSTSALADTSSVKGSFDKDKNSFVLGDKFAFTMTASDSALYETITRLDNDKMVSNSKIDIVFGSGTKGQSYLSWTDDSLFQLQGSYFAPTESWTNSPGYPDRVGIKRPIQSRCMECHTTYADNVQAFSAKNRYNKEQILYGVDCERCHGPSANHVGFHTSNPEIVKAKFMIQTDALSRQQRLDACALCHSGIRGESKQLPFSFMTGDKLDDFSSADYKEGDEINLDVHSNQYGLLTQSKCFKEAITMDCTTCHNPHEKERGNTINFNSKCISCHSESETTCAADVSVLNANANNCISCHMPLTSSAVMQVQIAGDTIPVEVRTHLIAIYLETL